VFTIGLVGDDVRPHQAPWAGLVMLLLVTFTVSAVDAAWVAGNRGVMYTMRLSVETAYIALPATAAAAVTMYRVSRAKVALIIVAFATATMVASDFIPTTGAPRRDILILEADGTASTRFPSTRWTASGALVTVGSCVAQPDCPTRSDGVVTAGTQVFLEALAFFKIAYLLAPLVAVGVCRWIYLWAEHSFVVMSRNARWALDFTLTWVSPVLVVIAILSFSSQAMEAMLARGEGPAPLLSAYVPLCVISGLAWTFTPKRSATAHD